MDMLDATIIVSPPRLSAAAKGKARLSSPPNIEALEDVKAADIDFGFDFGDEVQESASDPVQENTKSSDKSSSSSSYREKYTDVKLPLGGEREDSAQGHVTDG